MVLSLQIQIYVIIYLGFLNLVVSTKENQNSTIKKRVLTKKNLYMVIDAWWNTLSSEIVNILQMMECPRILALTSAGIFQHVLINYHTFWPDRVHGCDLVFMKNFEMSFEKGMFGSTNFKSPQTNKKVKSQAPSEGCDFVKLPVKSTLTPSSECMPITQNSQIFPAKNCIKSDSEPLEERDEETTYFS